MRSVPGYPRFQIADDLSIYRDGIKVQVGDQKSDYIFIADGYGGTVKRATLICLAFHGSKPFPEAEVAHWDGNSHNDDPDNLRWATHSSNLLDIKRTRPNWHVGERNSNCKLSNSDVDNIKYMYYTLGISQVAIAKEYGVWQSQISRIIRGEQRAIR